MPKKNVPPSVSQGNLPITNRIPNRRLRAAREARGWSQGYVAEMLGTTNRTIIRWENGASKPHAYHVPKLCELFGMNASELGLEYFSPAEATISQTLFPALVPELPEDIVGREGDLEAVLRRLLRDESMAVVGIGGVGKTTLALMLVHHKTLQGHFSNGILWGALGPGGNGQEIVSSWGQALGYSAKQMSSTSGEKSRGLLRAAIGNRAMLLVLDDVWDEHIALTLREVAGPRCRWLYTSRSRKVAQDLVGGQRTYTLGELTIEQSVQVIRQLAPVAVDQEPTEIASLVRSVGGVPLALRLIGRTLAKQAGGGGQARRVQKCFEDLHEVRENLYSAIAVSEYALSDHTRAALYALSVLPAKPECFSQEAALAVTEGDLSTLSALRDFSLLEHCGPDSYRMHQVVASYSRQQLQRDPAAHQAAYARLFHYVVSMVQKYENDYQQLDWESQTIMAALEAAVNLGKHEMLLQIMLCAAPFFSYRGWNEDAERFLAQACAVARAERRLSHLPRLLLFFADVAYKLAAHEEAMKAQFEGLHLARLLHNEELTAAFVARLAWQTYLFGNYDQAEEYIKEGTRLFASTSRPNPKHLCTLLRAQGSLAWARGEYQVSEQAYLQGLEVMRDLDERDWDHLSIYSCFLGYIEGMRGHYEQAERYFQQSLAAAEAYLPDFWPFVQGLRIQVILLHHPSRALREDLGQAITRALELTAIGYSIYVWKALALLELILRNYDKAEKYAGYALERARQFRGGGRVGELLTVRAQIEGARGNTNQAASMLHEALPLVKAKSPVEEIAGTLVTLGEVYLCTGQLAQAAQAFEDALAFAPAEHLPLLALTRYGQARTAAARGDKKEARRQGEAALAVFRQIRHYRVKEVEEWLAQYRHPWLRLFTFGRQRAKKARLPQNDVSTEQSASFADAEI